jgi:hypothetical protein
VKSPIRPRLLPVLWLVALLLLAQALGLTHRIEHALPAAHGDELVATPAGHEAGGAECRLIDQHGLGDGICDPWPLPAPVERPTPWLATWAVVAVALPAPAAYHARAPPA